MAVKDIYIMGADVLRKQSAPVEEQQIKTEQIQSLIDDMIETASQTPDGDFITAGLAAPQIGESLRIFLAMKDGSDKKSPEYEVYINPELDFPGSETAEGEESCLSTPGLCGIIRRHREVRVSYLDREGNRQRKKLTGEQAIFIQHEYDHLEGILWVDKVADSKSIRYCG